MDALLQWHSPRSGSWNHVTCLSKRRMLQQKQKRKPVVTMGCRAVRDWFLSLGASSRWMGSLFRRLRNAVRHRDEPINHADSKACLSVAHNTLRIVTKRKTLQRDGQIHQNGLKACQYHRKAGCIRRDTLVAAPMWFLRTSQRDRRVFFNLFFFNLTSGAIAPARLRFDPSPSVPCSNKL